MAYRIAVDIGGTFTDFCVFDDATKQLTTSKSPVTANEARVGNRKWFK